MPGRAALVAAALAISALSLIPTWQRLVHPAGQAPALVVYLFHGFLVKGAEYADVGALTERDPVTGFLVVTGAAVLVSLLLSATPVARRLNKLVDPISTLSSVPPLTGPIFPQHHRDDAQRRLALMRRRPPQAPLGGPSRAVGRRRGRRAAPGQPARQQGGASGTDSQRGGVQRVPVRPRPGGPGAAGRVLPAAGWCTGRRCSSSTSSCRGGPEPTGALAPRHLPGTPGTAQPPPGSTPDARVAGPPAAWR